MRSLLVKEEQLGKIRIKTLNFSFVAYEFFFKTLAAKLSLTKSNAVPTFQHYLATNDFNIKHGAIHTRNTAFIKQRLFRWTSKISPSVFRT